MAELQEGLRSNPTLLDWAKRLAPDGKIDRIVELLNQTTPILEDVIWIEGNLPTGHRTTVRTGLPAPVWRKLYGGVQPTKSTTQQVDDACGMLENYLEVDKDLADLNGNKREFLLSENVAHFEAFGQQIAQALIYGNATENPAMFSGLAVRYNELDVKKAKSAQNVLSAGGTGTGLTSMYLVGWGRNTIHGIFPKGSKAGLTFDDKGQVTAQDSEGGYFEAYRSHFQWKAGLTVRDWRYGARVCNIKVSDLENLTGTQALTAKTSIIKLMSRAIDRLPSRNGIRPVFYASRTLYSLLSIAAMEKTVNVLSIESGLNQFGESWERVKFKGIPIRIMDTISDDEDPVV